MFGLSAAGAALFALFVLWAVSSGSRIRIIVAAVLGAIIPAAAAVATGMVTLGSSIAPMFNTLAGGG